MRWATGSDRKGLGMSGVALRNCHSVFDVIQGNETDPRSVTVQQFCKVVKGRVVMPFHQAARDSFFLLLLWAKSASGSARRGWARDYTRSEKVGGRLGGRLTVLTPVPWALCVKALPVLTILTSSDRRRSPARTPAQAPDRLGTARHAAIVPLASGTPDRLLRLQQLRLHELAYAVSDRANVVDASTSTSCPCAFAGTRRRRSAGKRCRLPPSIPRRKCNSETPCSHRRRVGIPP